MLWDVFISYASEDKEAVARPLAEHLESLGLRVWFDETQLMVGDSLRARIDEGLAQSRFGVIVLSPNFFRKSWTQDELAGLFARRTRERGIILPVWHEVSSEDVLEQSPMLADLVAVSTSTGIEKAALAISRRAAPYLTPPDRDAPLPYSNRLELPLEVVSRALDVLSSMHDPATWEHLKITAPGYPGSGWMGCDSSVAIQVLHGFLSPLFIARAFQYKFNRNVALIEKSEQLQFALLKVALDTFIEEGILASMPPAIPYSPRVPRWREKRMQDPARFWWQGLSPDRFDNARSLFLRSSSTDKDSFELIPIDDFRAVYHKLYGAGCPDRKQQQTLGLLGNGFYGFTPRSRPVLWRVLLCQEQIYRVVANSASGGPGLGVDIQEALLPSDGTYATLMSKQIPDECLYEPLQDTITAVNMYLESIALPRISALCSL